MEVVVDQTTTTITREELLGNHRSDDITNTKKKNIFVLYGSVMMSVFIILSLVIIFI